ncbi:MAG: hypothetical protein IE911_11830 [Brevundimonas sp.]|nr:hypothetical protein [Brevundimonas sp.]
MKSRMKIVAAAAVTALSALSVAGPVAAQTWTLFSTTDRTAYLVDADTLAATDGMATTRLARVPRTGDAGELNYDTEEVEVRCSDQQSRSGLSVSYGPDGAETDRYSEESPWERAPDGTIYADVVSFVCGDRRPAGTPYPDIAAFIAAGRK